MAEKISKAAVAKYAMLRHKKYRDKLSLFIAEGEKCVSELLGIFCLKALICRDKAIVDLPQQYLPKALMADNMQMEKLSSLSTPPDVIAIFEKPRTAEVEIDKSKLYLALDGVQDPGNLGTIIRTADWFGIPIVFVSSSTADVYNPKCLQSTMGSLARVKVVSTKLEDLIAQNPQMPVYGTFLDGDNLYAAELSPYGIIVMGNEGNGISEDMRKCIENKLRIPEYNPLQKAESLNVAIATAVVVAEFRRRENIWQR